MKVRVRVTALFLSLALSLGLTALAAPAPSDQAMRGVWVSSVYNLDYPKSPSVNAASLRQQADAVLDGAKSMGLNAVFLQVRPSADALYPSDLFPWSQYLTGSCGAAPTDGFDPLRYFIDGAHARGLKLHAWLNPYRITKGKDAEWNALPATHPAKLHPEYAVRHTDGNYYFDPGLPAVRRLIEDGVSEILVKYPDIDGIHLDDYFYPGEDFNDADTFARYGGGFSSIGDWRRENVNILVRELDALIHSKKPEAQFGISPSGVWANQSDNPRGSNTRGGNPSYSKAYADTLAWISEGTVDYVCPQLYWYMGQSAADYNVLIEWWSNAVRGTDVALYIGEAAYKCDDPEQGDVWKGSAELLRHLAACETQTEVDGHIFFRYGSFDEVDGLRAALTNYYAAATGPAGGADGTDTAGGAPLTSGDAARGAGFLQTFLLFLQAVIR